MIVGVLLKFYVLYILDIFPVILSGFPLGGILRTEQNFSLPFLISSTQEITRQRKSPLRAQNSA
jgi:hypothetical protein